MSTLYNLVKSRMLYQFRDSPNLLKLFENVYDQTQSVYDLLIDLRDNRDILTAKGVWLNVIGDLLGLERPFKDLDPQYVFTFRSLGEASNDDMGFYSSGPPARGGRFQSNTGITSDPPEFIDDDRFRQLILAKAISNNSGGTIPDLFRFLNNFAEDMIISENTVGEVLISILPGDWIGQSERHFIVSLGPVPAGIRLEIMNWR